MSKAGLVVALAALGSGALVLALARSPWRVSSRVPESPACAQPAEPPRAARSGTESTTNPLGERAPAAGGHGADPRRLFGTIVAVDEAGIEHAGEDGGFRLGFSLYDSAVAVEVHGGCWRAERPREW